LMYDFAKAMVRERRIERRWTIAIRALWLALFMAIAWGLFTQRSLSGEAHDGTHTAVIDISGEISADSEASASNIIQSLDEAFDAPNAKAVVLRINSPGGSPVQAGLVYDEVRRLRGLHPDRKVYAVIGDIGASAAYYIASSADEIVASRASLVGSIGVISSGFGFPGLMDKLGIERRVMASGPNKDMLDPFAPEQPGQKAVMQAALDTIYKQFITDVRAGRGSRLKEDDSTFSGAVWTGEQAIKLGLIDRLGGLNDLARDTIKAPELINYTQRENIAQRLAKRIGASAGAAAVESLAGTARLH
ncbi:signal peptide peptidase SppA, partial [Amphibiibacter pelophylacis]